MTAIDLSLPELYAENERRKRGASLKEEAETLAADLPSFIRAAWHLIEKRPYVHNWHIDAISDVLTSVSHGTLRKVQIWIPPGTMKSRSVSILWPAWEWTRDPTLRYFSASYEIGLAGRLAARHRDIVRSTGQDPLARRPARTRRRTLLLQQPRRHPARHQPHLDRHRRARRPAPDR